MQKEQCFYIGYFSKVIGHRGEINLNLDVDQPDRYKELESVFVQMNKTDEQLVPFFIQHVLLQSGNRARILIEGINNQVEAKSLVGKQVFLPLDLLPPLSGNQFYFHEVTSYEIIDAQKGAIGKLKQVLEYPHQAVLEISHPSGSEILVPIYDEVIVSVDRKKSTLHIKAPEGLIELYLNSE